MCHVDGPLENLKIAAWLSVGMHSLCEHSDTNQISTMGPHDGAQRTQKSGRRYSSQYHLVLELLFFLLPLKKSNFKEILKSVPSIFDLPTLNP